MIERVKRFLREGRHQRALLRRQRYKYLILLQDMRAFREGRRTAIESWNWRRYAYAEIDSMTDDEILGGWR